MIDTYDVSEAEEAATIKDRALANFREQIRKGEFFGVIDLYERAAWDVGASVVETEAIREEERRLRHMARGAPGSPWGWEWPEWLECPNREAGVRCDCSLCAQERKAGVS